MKSLVDIEARDSAQSPSTRREWIEIPPSTLHYTTLESPSTRREWIEIMVCASLVCLLHRLPPHGGSGLKYRLEQSLQDDPLVSLHTEGVD